MLSSSEAADSSCNNLPTSDDEKRSSKVMRRKSVDEMTMLLDQMIQDKVESGQVVRGDRGSLRLKRDTVMEEAANAGADVSA